MTPFFLALKIEDDPFFLGSLTLSPDRRTVTMDLFNASIADDLRIITVVPEPASLSLFALAVVALRRGTRTSERR